MSATGLIRPFFTRSLDIEAVTVTGPEGLAMVADEIHDSTSFLVRFGEPHVTSLYRLSLDKYGVALAGGRKYALHIDLLETHSRSLGPERQER